MSGSSGDSNLSQCHQLQVDMVSATSAPTDPNETSRIRRLLNSIEPAEPSGSLSPPSNGNARFEKWRMQFRWWMLCRRALLCRHIYASMGPRTIRIGPRTVLKWGTDVDISEVDAMRFVAENTTIPVPKVLDTWKHGRVRVIKMQYVEGALAWNAWNRLSPAQRENLCLELEQYVTQLRSLSPPSPRQVSATHGGPCRDHRFGILPIGPFENHDNFHRFLREGDDLHLLQSRYPEIVALHSGLYVSHFTHGDLALWNVLVHKGKIAAIIDWDSSGWRPEYWEYTKVHFNPLGVPQPWFDAIKRATGDYDEHLKGERCLWNSFEFPSSPVIYSNGATRGDGTRELIEFRDFL